jgi:hypothetical protein
MAGTLTDLIAAIIVVAAFAAVGWRFYRQFRGGKKRCGGGCCDG